MEWCTGLLTSETYSHLSAAPSPLEPHGHSFFGQICPPAMQGLPSNHGRLLAYVSGRPGSSAEESVPVVDFSEVNV